MQTIDSQFDSTKALINKTALALLFGVNIDSFSKYLRKKIDSKFDSTEALINKTGRALRARQSGFCRAFVESNVESVFCVNVSKFIKIKGNCYNNGNCYDNLIGPFLGLPVVIGAVCVLTRRRTALNG